MVGGNDVLQSDSFRRQRQIVEQLFVAGSRRRRLPRFVNKNQDRESLLLAGRVDVQQCSNEINLKSKSHFFFFCFQLSGKVS